MSPGQQWLTRDIYIDPSEGHVTGQPKASADYLLEIAS